MHKDHLSQDGIAIPLADDLVRAVHWLVDVEAERCREVLDLASPDTDADGDDGDRAAAVDFLTSRLHDCEQLLAAVTTPVGTSPGSTELTPRVAAFLRDLALEMRLDALQQLEDWTASAMEGMAWGDGHADAEIVSLRCRRVLEALEQAALDRLETMVQAG